MGPLPLYGMECGTGLEQKQEIFVRPFERGERRKRPVRCESQKIQKMKISKFKKIQKKIFRKSLGKVSTENETENG